MQLQNKASSEELIYSRQWSICNMIPKNERSDFASNYIGSDESFKQTPEQMEKNEKISVFTFLGKNKIIDSIELLKNRITKESLSVFNFDGFMRNTKRSKLKEKMNNSTIDMVSIGELSCVNCRIKLNM